MATSGDLHLATSGDFFMATDSSYPGFAPYMATNSAPSEAPFQNQLAEEIGGLVEVRLPFGRADVMTAERVYEVEHFGSWRNGARQVLAYAQQTGIPGSLAVIGDATEHEVRRVYRELRSVGLGLLWHDGQRWIEVGSKRHVRAISGHPEAASLTG